MWILLSISSAVLLGFYDLAKKSSVRDNAVPPVLLANVLTAAAIYAPFMLWSRFDSSSAQATGIYIAPATLLEHVQLLLKSTLVGSSWTCAFFGLKHLPISIATPIRATSPMWTILIAVGLLAERPSMLQWMGLMVILIAFAAFSVVGKREGIRFTTDRWVGLMILATLLGSLSALYDKYLLQSCKIPPIVLQAWFSVYLVPVMLPLTIYWYATNRKSDPFQWRWAIPCIAISLLAADYLYFSALHQSETMISLVSPLRRTSVIIPFLFGVLVLGEKSWKAKLCCITAMLLGVLIIGLG